MPRQRCKRASAAKVSPNQLSLHSKHSDVALWPPFLRPLETSFFRSFIITENPNNAFCGCFTYFVWYPDPLIHAILSGRIVSLLVGKSNGMADERRGVQHDFARASMNYDCSDLVQHYHVSGNSVHGVLSEILETMTSFKAIHSWDDRLIISPLAALKAVCAKFIQPNQNRLDILLRYATVEESCMHQGSIYQFPAMVHPGDVERHLSFINVSMCNYERVSRDLRLLLSNPSRR
jgi:hypothetical protein